MANKGTATRSRGVDDADVDRFPNLKQILSELAGSDGVPDVPIERLELTTLANGDATYRYWEPRAEESEGGFISGA